MQVSLDDTENAWLGRVVLNRLPIGIAVLDATGLVLFANALAISLFDSAELVVKTTSGRLRFVDEHVERKFRHALVGVASGGATRENTNEILVLQRSRGAQMPLVVAVCAVAAETATASPCILITFADAADALSATSVGRLADFFGLTRAEQRLTQFLASGGSLRDAARKFGVSPHTVRNQLRAVFAKSGVQRQTDLTRLVMTGGVANFPAVRRPHNNSGREMPHVFH